ncbi:Transcription initiation factor TFIID subunit 12 [Parahypoxylon ruwenzoriense]
MNQQPQGQATQGQGQPPGLHLLQPKHIRGIGYLSADEKTKYEEGLKQLYAKMEQNPPDSQEHLSAKQKVIDFSRMVYNKIKTIQARSQASSQGQPVQPGQPGHPSAQLQGSQGGQYQNALTPTQPTQKPPMQPNRAQGPGAGPNAMNPGAPTPSAAPAAAQGPPVISKTIMDHVNKLPWGILPTPPQLTPEQGQKWLAETKSRYLRYLVSMENIKSRTTRLDALLKDRQEKGQHLPPEEQKKVQDQKMQDQRIYQEAERFIKGVRSQMQAAGQNGGAQGPNAQQSRSQPMQPQNLGSTASSHPMQAATASVNAAMDAAKNQQLAATNRPTGPAGQPQPQPQPQVQHPGTPATPATPSIGAPQQQHHQQQPQQQPPTHPTPTPQPQVKNEPGTNIQHPPPVNTALAAAASAHIPTSAGTPTQPSARVQTPQSAGQQAPGSQVRPLTHAAAVHRANSSTNIAGHPNNSSGGIASTPGSGGLAGSASHSGHPHAHPQPNPPALNPKMPISKQLPAKAIETPTAASVGGGTTPGRPTMGGGGGTGGGVMGQTVIPKMTIPQYDADADHVLSKKKLDELVRQVCGGGSPGADGNYLTPDVEESVLNMADNFIDSVLHMACRLAKERGSKVLEIRDIQLILERVHNIRIPGYTSDELRTVRKVQPSGNWISKVHAVQAAKVMPGKDDK